MNNPSEQHSTSVKQSRKPINPFTNNPNVDGAEASAQCTKEKKERRALDQNSCGSHFTALNVANTSNPGLGTTSPTVPGCRTQSAERQVTLNKAAIVSPKAPAQTKRSYNEDIKDGSGHSGSSSKRLKQKHPVRGKSKISDANDRRKDSETLGIATQPPHSSHILKPATPSYRSHQDMRTPSKTHRPAQHGKHCNHWSGSNQRSAPALFKAVHIPGAPAHNPTTAGQYQTSNKSPHLVRRHQPAREVKVIPSIEHQVDPRNPSHTPYPWDDPLISDVNHHRFSTLNDQHGKTINRQILVIILT